MAGLTYQNYNEVMNVMDIEHYSVATFQQHSCEMQLAVQEELDLLLEVNRQESAANGSLWVTFDGGWSNRGWTANECTVVMFDAMTGKLLDIEHVVRKLP